MKFQSEPIEEHQEVPLADEGQWEALVSHWKARESGPKMRAPEGNRCYVVSVVPPEEQRSAGRLHEILGLVTAQEDQIVGHEIQRLKKIDPRTYLGKGLSKAIAERAREQGADLLVLDMTLTPSQTRNLEDLAGIAICDREAVILNVFLKHARSRSSRIQVEIAHLEYLRPRIRGLGLNMDQQAGGIMGSRGPGETASELMARKLDTRLSVLRKNLAKLDQQGESQRKHRTNCRRIALAGYTNAGKTSLMNVLTDAEGSARNMPFETLDTTTRCLTRHGGDVLLSDTVGFIRDLPKRLFTSFASTLAEIIEASLIAIVIDASDPDRYLHLETTETMLEELDARDIPRLYIFNKMDQSDGDLDECLAHIEGHDHLCVSAHNKADVDAVKEALLSRARSDKRRANVFVPYAATAAMSQVYATCRVLDATPDEHGMYFSLEGEAAIVTQIEQAATGVTR